MKPSVKPVCPRLFEAEALRDGRLTGTEVARFQAHLGVCPTCAHEVKTMQAVGDALRAPQNSHEADQLHVRRERTRLLAAFDASLVPAQRSRGTFWLAAVAALVVVSTLVIVLWHTRPLPSVATAAEPVRVQANGATRWSRQTASQRETVVLESGTLSIRVDHALPHRRLLVLLPDGELEDIGTTFSVTADAGHTTRVTVQDGSVVLRLHDLAPLTLRAGDAWAPAPTPAIAPIATAISTDTASAPNVRSARPPLPATAPSVSAPAPAADAATDFRAAMLAFNGGDNPRAAALFGTFLAQYPRDARAEDAAYLRVLAVQRTGSVSGMKQAAADYLSRYPRGFRRSEIEPLSH